MNPSQKVVLLVTAAILLAALLFPPFTHYDRQGATENAGYAFIFSPPTYKTTGEIGAEVNVSLLSLEYLFIATIGALLFLTVKPK